MKPGFAIGCKQLKNALCGSRDALGCLLQDSIPYLHSIIETHVRREISDREGQLDLVQETHLRALRGFNRFHGTTEKQFCAWLRRILLNVLADDRLMRRRLPGSLPETYEIVRGKAASWDAEQAEYAATLERALKALNPHYRRILLLRNGTNWTWKTIGQRLNCSADAVRKTHFRAMQAFAQLTKGLDPPK